jgi:hypothetical protein
MSNKPSDSPAHAYEAEPYPILNAWAEFWWMPEPEKTATLESLARKNGGQGCLPRPGGDREYER